MEEKNIDQSFPNPLSFFFTSPNEKKDSLTIKTKSNYIKRLPIIKHELI